MTSTATVPTGSTQLEILFEVLTGGEPLKLDLAQWLLTLRFTEKQEARMLELAERNTEGTLLPSEREEMLNYAHAGNLLSFLQSKARLALRNVSRSA